MSIFETAAKDITEQALEAFRNFKLGVEDVTSSVTGEDGSLANAVTQVTNDVSKIATETDKLTSAVNTLKNNLSTTFSQALDGLSNFISTWVNEIVPKINTLE